MEMGHRSGAEGRGLLPASYLISIATAVCLRTEGSTIRSWSALPVPLERVRATTHCLPSSAAVGAKTSHWRALSPQLNPHAFRSPTSTRTGCPPVPVHQTLLPGLSHRALPCVCS